MSARAQPLSPEDVLAMARRDAPPGFVGKVVSVQFAEVTTTERGNANAGAKALMWVVYSTDATMPVAGPHGVEGGTMTGLNSWVFVSPAGEFVGATTASTDYKP